MSLLFMFVFLCCASWCPCLLLALLGRRSVLWCCCPLWILSKCGESLSESPLASQGVTERNGLGGKALRVGEKKLSWVCSERWSPQGRGTSAAERTKSKSAKSARAQKRLRESQPSMDPKQCLCFPVKGTKMALKRGLTAGEKELSQVYPQPVLLATEPPLQSLFHFHSKVCNPRELCSLMENLAFQVHSLLAD